MKHKTAELEGPRLLSRLLAKSVVQANGCREWQGKCNDQGYGKTKVGGKEVRAHRLMFFLTWPDTAPTLKVLHRCDNPRCIEPAHLFAGTQADNMADMRAKGRFKGGAKPGNRNSLGNTGWLRGGIVKAMGRIPASKLGEEVELP